MVGSDDTFMRERQKFYEEQYRGREPMDAWHAYSQKVAHKTARAWYSAFGKHRGPRLLNAGSGGSDYGISEPMTHLDLFESKIAHCNHHIVADISNIPVADNSFDVVLCIGSVLNYADPLTGIREISRVLRTEGLLILEYERSASPEYFRENAFRRSCCRVKTFYGQAPTYLWVYGDGFIDGLLSAFGFGRIAEKRFQILSSIVCAFTGSVAVASRCAVTDGFFGRIWPFKRAAANRMLAVEKLADQ
jgi:SAM-dependent methyltransferase